MAQTITIRLFLKVLTTVILLIHIISTEKVEAKNRTPEPNNQSKKQTDISSSGFSIYGNWCGPNHPPDVNNAPEPIDLLDQQCKTHDLCYVEKGYLDCHCDRVMVLEIDQTQKSKKYTVQQYLVAQNIKIHFAVSPCNGKTAGNKMLPTRILTNVYKGTKKRVINIYDRFIGNHFHEVNESEYEQVQEDGPEIEYEQEDTPDKKEAN